MTPFTPASRLTSRIEPLEARIAPARVIQVGGPNVPNKADFDYADFVDPRNNLPLFVNTETGADPISLAVGGGVSGVADTFYLRLGAGDKLRIYQSANSFVDFVNVTAGNAVAFFVDKDPDGAGPLTRDGEVQSNELVSLSLGRNARVEVLGGIEGDIITNLNEQGTASLADDSLDMTDLVSPNQSIAGLSVRGGSIGGRLLSGGNISNVTINDGVQAILAGSAAFGVSFDLLPGVPGGGGTLTGKPTNSAVVPGSGVVGASITNVSISNVSANTSIADRIEAGSGGAGARGGSISSVFIVDDTDGFLLKAGNGGNGDAVRKTGGAGGSVSRVYVAGQDDTNISGTNDFIGIRAGDGGSSTTGGNGGAGGAVSSIFVGFQFIGNRAVQTSGILADNVALQAGAGGAGVGGGVGGAISGVNVIVNTANGTNEEISVVAGAGGNSNLLSGGRPGAGGSISSVSLRNVSPTTGSSLAAGIGSSTLVQAGDGGTAVGLGLSAPGGSLSSVTLLGSDLRILAGNGSDGRVGGAGGSIRSVSVLEADSVIAHNLSLRAGRGGNGGQGSGGAGGLIDNVVVSNGDFSAFDFNPSGGGDGGVGNGGVGGAGGSIGRIVSRDTDSAALPAFEGTARLRAGNGGAGSLGGGTGGSVISGNVEFVDMNVVVTSGNGGSVLAGGRGNGGSAGYVRISAATSELVGLNSATVSVTAGVGGSAQTGTTGSGGLGGAVNRVVAVADGSVSVTAGDGGSGGTGAAGSGGSVISSVAFSNSGSAVLRSGAGGALGARPGNGGDIVGASTDDSPGAYGSVDVSIIAGNGTHGGRGGSIRQVGFGSTAFSGLAAPAGDVTVRAGDGSAEGRYAGAGGSITSINGSVTSGAGKFTRILAGDGGGSATATAAGAGGTINGLSLSQGGGAGSEIRIEAGDGGGGAATSAGGAGGAVSVVQIANVDAATVVRHIAAGDGGAGTRRGGNGGYVNDVTVLDEDIGVRSGQAFGFNTMGGVFAGAGGLATTTGASGKGLSGNVTNIRASAIAAIVAGKGAVPEAAGTVDFIYVGPATNLLKASEGDLNFADGGAAGWHSFVGGRYASASLVGAVVDPTAVDATKFRFSDTAVGGTVGVFEAGDTPIDGLIMAKVYRQQNTNFTPEARLVGGVFYDYDNLT